MARPDDIDEVEVVLAGEIIEVCIDKSQTRACSPVSEKSIRSAFDDVLAECSLLTLV